MDSGYQRCNVRQFGIGGRGSAARQECVDESGIKASLAKKRIDDQTPEEAQIRANTRDMIFVQGA